MLKKLLSIATLTALLVGGLSATQANAVTANVDPANVLNGGANFTIDLADDAVDVQIPAGLTSFQLRRNFQVQSEFLVPRAGQSLSVGFGISLPNGTPITSSDQMIGAANVPTYFPDVSGVLFGTGESVSWNYQSKSISIPADPSTYSGSINARYYVEAVVGQTFPAGTYTFSSSLKTSGGETVAIAEPGQTTQAPEVSYLVPGTTFTIPAGVTSTYVGGEMCVDVTKVAVGDVLATKVFLDGSAENFPNNFWTTKSGFKDQSEMGNRSFGMSTTSTTVTQYDIDWGLAVSTNLYESSLAVGTTHEVAFQLYNQDGVDVSGSCAPAKPAAPTLILSNGSISVSGEFVNGSNGQMLSKCYVYDAAAPTVEIRSVSVSINFMNRSSYTCTFGNLPTSKTYLVKFRDNYGGAFSEYSDASQILIPAGGWTITSTYAGVVEAKKIVKVSDNIIPIEDFSSNPGIVPDGNGGFYMFGSKNSACPPSCTLSELRLRKATATSLDSSFAGTGSVSISSFTPANGFASGVGFYGTNKDKWAIPVNGRNATSFAGETQVFMGNTTTSTVTSKLITAADVTPICEAASTGYAPRASSNMQINVVSAATTDLVLSIICQKTYTIGGTQTILSLPVLVSMNTSTGALTAKATMGTPSAEANNFAVRYSVNTAASGNEPMITAFVTSSLVTQINNPPTANGGTITDHAIVRLDSSLNVISTTTSGWATSGGTIASDPSLSVMVVNSGKIFGLTRFGSDYKVVTFGSTGAGTELAVNTSASEIVNPALLVLQGHPTPANETLFPVALSATGKDAAGWIDLTTGALTSGEVLTSTFSSGNGATKFWLRGTDKNSYYIYADSSKPENMTVLKWIDARYVAPVGAVPAVTSKDAKYSKNTPTAGAKVTLTGTNLDVVVSAKIGDNAATLGTKTATSLQLTIPTATAAGTVDITLTTASGDTVVDTFTYVGAGVAQIVTVGALAASVTVGDADLALSATVGFSPLDAGTAGAITWSSDTPTVCSIVANKARLLTAGTCTVKANAAASGVLLAGSGTQSTTVSAAPAAAQTVTLTGPTKVVVDLDGFEVVSSASSGLPVVYATTTPAICTVSAAGLVVAAAEGTCVITASQAGNANWLPATKELSITVAKTPTTPVTEKGDIKKPLALSKTGTFLKNGDTQLGWNRSKGTLAVKLSVVYVGPIKASVSFKVGSKTYTCTSSFGILKKQSSNKLITLTSPNLCTGKTEKTQLAALKKITTSTVVTVTIVRDMYLPTTYKKIRTKTRILYAKLG
jgi:hypothetical protein